MGRGLRIYNVVGLLNTEGTEGTEVGLNTEGAEILESWLLLALGLLIYCAYKHINLAAHVLRVDPILRALCALRV